MGVPIVTDLVDASAQPTRNTVAEVYAQVVKDLTDAQKSGALAKGTKDGFIGYWANLAIQARVYQTMGNHAEALRVAKEIIDAKKYTLYANDEWVDSWAEQFGSESIFEYLFSQMREIWGHHHLVIFLEDIKMAQQKLWVGLWDQIISSQDLLKIKMMLDMAL